jgi:hypothetical protein
MSPVGGLCFCGWCRVWVTRLLLGCGPNVVGEAARHVTGGWVVLLRVVLGLGDTAVVGVAGRTVSEGLPAMSPVGWVGAGLALKGGGGK